MIRSMQVYNAMQPGVVYTLAELASALPFSAQHVMFSLVRLCDMGAVERVVGGWRRVPRVEEG